MGDRRRSRFSIERIATVVLGLYLTGLAIQAFLLGQWLYTDYLGLRVPAPLALLGGLLLLLLGLARWKRDVEGP